MLRYGRRQNTSTYARPHLVPVFLDELSTSQRQDAESACGATDTACIYDYAVSGSQSFATMTKDLRDSAVKVNTAVSKCTGLYYISVCEKAQVLTKYIYVGFYCLVRREVQVI